MTRKVAFTYAGGHSRTLPELDDALADALLDAQLQQHAAHIIHLNGKQKLVVNLRNVCALLITDVTPEPEPEPEPEPTPESTEPEPAPEHETEPTPEAPVDEPAPEPEAPAEEPAPAPEAPAEPAPEPEAPAEPTPEEPAEDTRTVPQLKEALDAAGVTYDSSDRKADLQELAKTNGV